MGFISLNHWWVVILSIAFIPILFKAKDSYIKRCKLLGAASHRSPQIFLPASIILILAFATMRPYIGREEITIKGNGRDILFLIDVSKSMRTDDLHPSRLDVAKRKIKDAVQIIKKSGQQDRMGIVIFAGKATLFCPLTIDTAIISLYLESIDDEMISDPGSSLLAAVQEALSSDAKAPLLILLSDGEDNYLEAEEIKRLITEKKATLSSIGIGTIEGKPIALENGRFLKDKDGEIVISKLQEESLKTISSEGNGKYLRASLDDSDIKEILAQKTAVEGKGNITGEKIVVYGELSPLLAALSLILMMYGIAKKSLPFALLLLFISFRSEAESLYEGYKAYSSGEYKKAEEIFQSNLDSSNNSNIRESLGHSLYRQGRFKEAASQYAFMAKDNSSPETNYKGYYNLGNAKFMEGKFQDAISAYDKALEYRPNDEHSIFNREIAKKKLQEEKKQEQQNKSEENNEDQKKDDQNQKQEKKSQQSSTTDSEPNQQRQESSPDKEKKEGRNEENPEKNEQQNADKKPTKPDSNKKEQRALDTFLEGVDDSLDIPKPSKRRNIIEDSTQSW